jgi:hypothetical protein
MHLKPETLRAYLDNELVSSQHLQVKSHLSACSQCSQALESIRQRVKIIDKRMETLDAPPAKAISAKHAYARFKTKSEVDMKVKLLGRLRPVWSVLGLAAVLTVAFSFQPVRTVASNFLHLFRVQKVEVLPLNIDSVENFGRNSTVADTMHKVFSDSVVFTREKEETIKGLDLDGAQSLVDFPIRLPTTDALVDFNVESGAAFEFTVTLDEAQAIIDAAGVTDIQPPAELDGAVVEVEMYNSVATYFGDCELPEDLEEGKQPTRFDMADCSVLLQTPSPTVSTASDIDVSLLAEIGLRVIGLESADAKALSQSVDWTSTLVIPIPANEVEYEDISVDGVTGKLIMESNMPDEIAHYTIMWVKNGMIYSVYGTGDPQNGVDLISNF